MPYIWPLAYDLPSSKVCWAHSWCFLLSTLKSSAVPEAFLSMCAFLLVRRLQQTQHVMPALSQHCSISYTKRTRIILWQWQSSIDMRLGPEICDEQQAKRFRIPQDTTTFPPT
eukprot:507112-Amphidinium_carterae.1